MFKCTKYLYVSTTISKVCKLHFNFIIGNRIGRQLVAKCNNDILAICNFMLKINH